MITVVGIGADGWTGLAAPSRDAIAGARTVVGSARQLELLPDEVAGARRIWPSPIDPLVDELATTCADICVLASGDPMLHGIGATLARRRADLVVHPHPSAFALACARLHWPQAETTLVSAVGRAPDGLALHLQRGRKIVAFGEAQQLAAVARERGFGASRFVVLEQLGGPGERVTEHTAATFDESVHALHAVAIECAGDGLPRIPGLPDSAYDHDGQLTKRVVRAATISALAPQPGELLWDVGAGSGSIAIEWLRAEPLARAIAIEADGTRAARIGRNAGTLGVPGLQVEHGRAPAALADLPRPDAIFIGGGISDVLEACLQSGARIVANAVTLAGERALQRARESRGGTLTRLTLSHAEPLGDHEAWRPQLPVVQWSSTG
jgi:precorrin-6Y C5,15-methyltransferase (decarboxylating)